MATKPAMPTKTYPEVEYKEFEITAEELKESKGYVSEFVNKIGKEGWIVIQFQIKSNETGIVLAYRIGR